MGSSITKNIDVRIIAATNRSLKNGIKNGTFREDLFYRLNVFPITLPPLRDRKEDIPLLVQHFINVYSKYIGKDISTVTKGTLDILLKYEWPGNVRELENIIERAIVVARSNKLVLGNWFEKSTNTDSSVPNILTLKELEKNHIVKVLDKTGWKVSGVRGAANILGMKPTTLESRMKVLGIRRIIKNS